MAQSERGVLVVDDDHDIRSVVDQLLTDEGYQVKTASNGRDALAVLKRWRPRLILLDLMMPIMDGWGFLAKQRLSRKLRHIPVIVMSASHTISANEGRAAVVDMIAKPFDIDFLLAKVSAHVKAADASARLAMVAPKPIVARAIEPASCMPSLVREACGTRG